MNNAYEIIHYTNQSGIQLVVQAGDILVRASKGKISPELLQCLARNKQEIIAALNYYGFTLADLQQDAGTEWEEIKDNKEALIAYANILYEQRLMRNGQVPESFTSYTYCASCAKQVPIRPELANKGHVLSCPWCASRNDRKH